MTLDPFCQVHLLDLRVLKQLFHRFNLAERNRTCSHLFDKVPQVPPSMKNLLDLSIQPVSVSTSAPVKLEFLTGIVHAKDFTEFFELRVSCHTNNYVIIISCAVNTIWGDVRMRVAHPLVLFLAVKPGTHNIAQREQACLQERSIDVLPFSSALTVNDSCQYAL